MIKLKYIAGILLLLICTAFITEKEAILPGTAETSEAGNATQLQTLITTVPARAKFSGRWKLNAPKSETGQFGVGDKTCLNWLSASKTLNIVVYRDYLTVDLVTNFNDGTPMPRQEKLNFDGKEVLVSSLGTLPKKSAASWSDDGYTFHVNSITNYPGLEIKTTEVWKLINEGKNLFIQSNSNAGENIMKLVYDRAD